MLQCSAIIWLKSSGQSRDIPFFKVANASCELLEVRHHPYVTFSASVTIVRHILGRSDVGQRRQDEDDDDDEHRQRRDDVRHFRQSSEKVKDIFRFKNLQVSNFFKKKTFQSFFLSLFLGRPFQITCRWWTDQFAGFEMSKVDFLNYLSLSLLLSLLLSLNSIPLHLNLISLSLPHLLFLSLHLTLFLFLSLRLTFFLFLSMFNVLSLSSNV